MHVPVTFVLCGTGTHNSAATVFAVEAGDTCTKRCVCDGGFGQCKLQESCEIGTKHCLKGTDCSAGTHEDDEETPLPSKSVAGVPVWAVVVAVVGSALFGSCAMMLMVISRDMRNGNSLHSKLYSGIDMEDMEKSDMLAECNEDLLTSEVHQSP